MACGMRGALEGPEVSEPQTIGEYLDELDDALNVGLARRERILTEAHAHLEEAASAHEDAGASRAQAERLALSAFGSPHEVARASDAASRLRRAVEVLADLCYRVGVRNRREALGSLAVVTVTGVVCAVDAGWWLAWPLASMGLVLLHLVMAGPKALSAPRPGYARRWLKLERSARTRVLGALNEGRRVTESEDVEFAAEVAHRLRWLTAARWVWALSASHAEGVAVFYMIRGSAGAAAFFGFLGVLFLVAAMRSSPRQRAEDELRLLDVVDQVVREAGARARLEEGRGRDGTYPDPDGAVTFWLVPVAEDATAVELAADGKVIALRVGWYTQKLRGPNRLRELRLCLAAVVTGRYWEAGREVLVPGRLVRRPRQCLEVTRVFETERGLRHFTDRYRWPRALEEHREALEQHGLGDRPDTTLQRRFPPYPSTSTHA